MMLEFRTAACWPKPRSLRKFAIGVATLILSLPLLGCHSGKKPAETPEPKVNGETVTLPAHSPQLAALMIEPAASQETTSMFLAGRLLWDENATVRVFSPFAGIVRKLLVEVNQQVAKGAPLAEIQSSDFGQALAEARKAESDFRRVERNLNRVRDLAEHGAAPRKDVGA